MDAQTRGCTSTRVHKRKDVRARAVHMHMQAHALAHAQAHTHTHTCTSKTTHTTLNSSSTALKAMASEHLAYACVHGCADIKA
eukprot:2928637-Alexandrium_andersonii.AAC.1